MPLDVSLDRFTTQNASTGDQAFTISGGFQPKVYIVFGTTAATPGTWSGSYRNVFGASVSSTNDWCTTNSADNNQAQANTGRENVSAAYNLRNPSGTLLKAAGHKQFDASGFTWTFTNGIGVYPFLCLSLGGSDISNVNVTNHTVPGVTGNQVITGIGFRPKSQVYFGVFTNIVASNALNSYGFCDGTNKFAVSWGSVDNVSTVNSMQGFNEKPINVVWTPNVDWAAANFVSFDSDGMTINWTTVPGGTRWNQVLSLAGDLQTKVGSFQTITSTGNQAITGVGFQPKAVLFMGTGNTSVNTIIDHNQACWGCATSSTNRFATAWNDEDGVTTSQVNSYNSDNRCILVPATTGQSFLAEADFVSMNSDGFTINWTANSLSTGTQVAYMALGDAPTVATGNRFLLAPSLESVNPPITWSLGPS